MADTGGRRSCRVRQRPYQTAFTGDDPLLRHVRTRIRSPQTNGVIERFFGTLKYEHLYRAPIDDGGALAMETSRLRDIYNRIRPHQSLGDRTPRDAYLGVTGRASVQGTVTDTQQRAGLTGPRAFDSSAAVLDARRVPVAVPFRTQHPLGVVVNRPSAWPDR